jgi:outer membrane receptor protein involved in Fe transport
MKHFFHASVGIAGVLLALCSSVSAAQQPTTDGLLLDSLLNTRISTVSKYAQTTAEAPASVTIVSADEIREFGYRNLNEVLESVRGIYFSNDHNYAYVGTRGFGRPTDYNNRILVLVDGHTLNEHVWGSAPVGADLTVNLSAVERIEVVRGPGSVLYGTSAMFAVINIVTKTGTQLDGVVVSGRVGSGGRREGAFAAGHAIGALGSVAFSSLVTHSDGFDQYYPEYDAPATNNGVVRGRDWDNGLSGLGSLVLGDVTARAGFVSHTKGVPTGAYGTTFGDSRSKTVDESLWAEIAVRRDLSATHHVLFRAYADRYKYRGGYPSVDDPDYTDSGASTSEGVEGNFIWDPTSRARFTFGSEFLHVGRASYKELFAGGVVVSDDAPLNVSSLFVQSDLEISSMISAVAGVRVDKRSRFDAALTPRLALVTRPDSRTTLKLLYGEAFRAPSAAEADLTTSLYTENPGLRPERIRTLELDLQRRVTQPLLIGVSLYHYAVRDLIDQVADVDNIEFRNVASATGRGLEMQVDLVPGGPFSTRATYTVQRTRDGTTGERLTNSPQQVATISGIARSKSGIRSAFTVRHESPRRTVVGTWTPAFARSDVTLGFAPSELTVLSWATGLDASVRVRNLFAAAYSTPGGIEHLQAAIPQDGRVLSLSLDWTF